MKVTHVMPGVSHTKLPIVGKMESPVRLMLDDRTKPAASGSTVPLRAPDGHYSVVNFRSRELPKRMQGKVHILDTHNREVAVVSVIPMKKTGKTNEIDFRLPKQVVPGHYQIYVSTNRSTLKTLFKLNVADPAKFKRAARR